MRKYGILEKIIRITRLFYDDFECAVEDEGEACEWFNMVTCRVLLFLIVMDWVMRRTVKSRENGNRWRLTSKLDDLDFADGMALLSSTKQHIQNKTNRMNKEAKRVGLKINKEKTKVMRINAKSQEKITVDGQDIKEVKTFNYLGATICKEGGGIKDIKNRLSKARGAFVRLNKIRNSKSISRRTKLRLYKTLAVPSCCAGARRGK